MPGTEGFGQGQLVLGGDPRDVLEAVEEGLPLLGLHRGHRWVSRVMPAAGFLDGLEAVEEMLPALVRVLSGGVMQVQEQVGSKGRKATMAASRTMAVLGLAVGLVSVGLGVWWSPGMSAAGVILAVPVVYSAAGVILALPGVIAVARGMTAFRADCAGITLGPVPDNLTFLAAGPCSSVGRDRG